MKTSNIICKNTVLQNGLLDLKLARVGINTLESMSHAAAAAAAEVETADAMPFQLPSWCQMMNIMHFRLKLKEKKLLVNFNLLCSDILCSISTPNHFPCDYFLPS